MQGKLGRSIASVPLASAPAAAVSSQAPRGLAVIARAAPSGSFSAPRRLLGLACASVAMLAALGCDGTLTGTHQTRGTLPALTPEPMPSATAARTNEPFQIAARHLLVMHKSSRSAPPTMLRTRAEARARAEKALERAKAGEPFEDLVAEYSDEPGASETGGDLGKFSRKKMVKKFSDAAFLLNVGEISGVVETDFGFHVIKRTE
jgi:peptidyl-prolyl cis-trans isomerase NIMA-interacting 1